MEKVVDRFLKYVSFDSQSNESSEQTPSTPGQIILAEYLTAELKDIGLTEVYFDKRGYVYASISKNIDKNVPVIGFISHLDTSPDMSGKEVKPKIFKDYNGKDIILNETLNILLSPKEFPELLNYKNHTIITTDGTTLLGADDKAGIAEIITAIEYIIKNNIKHGDIKIAFTPDEEIGRGTELFDFNKFNADFAYTIDSGEIGLLEYENFNAANAVITIKGKNIHPGNAKNKMKNSILIAYELQSLLPVNERPECTEGYEGFFHLNSITGNVEDVKLFYLIRDHDKSKFEKKKSFLEKCIDKLNKKYGEKTIKADIKDVYYNMKDKISSNMEVIEIVKKAMNLCSITPKIEPIRGGTDGAKLSYKGLLCPNIFTGGHNAHGKYEYIPVQSMIKAVEVIIKIIEINTEK